MAAPENGKRRTERAGATRQTFHGHGARDKRATGRGTGKTVECFEKNTKNTKDHEDTQSTPQEEPPMFLRFARKTFGSPQIKAD